LSNPGQALRTEEPELPVGTHPHGVACGSVFGPPNLESVAAIHREVLNIPPDPPGNGPDVTQIKNFRQQKSGIFFNGGYAAFMGFTELRGLAPQQTLLK
jgi:hypothetical protein